LPKREPIKVDREKVCPTLVRVFTREDRSHSVDDFKDGKLPSSDQEIQIHTWQDASLRELTQLIQTVREKARSDGARLVFNLVTVDRSGVFSMRQIGSIYATRSARDDEKTLYELGFEPGDYIDVAIQAR
jgi:histone deacetylase complex subunit SAP18